MRLSFATLVLCLAAVPAGAAQTITLPSGRIVTYLDTLQDARGPDGLTYRFRFLDPSIAQAQPEAAPAPDGTADAPAGDDGGDITTGEDDGSTDEGDGTPDQTLADLTALCESFALPRIPATGPMPQQIVISLADRPVPFGQADPEATQFFEAFRPENGRCVWEGF